MTRAHHTRCPRKARTSRSRKRNATSSPLTPSGDGSSAGPPNQASAPGGPRICDALAIAGLLLSTLDPSVVIELLTKIASYGADLFLAIYQSAQRTAEHTSHQAGAQVVRGAGSSRRRRGRSSRTTSRP